MAVAAVSRSATTMRRRPVTFVGTLVLMLALSLDSASSGVSRRSLVHGAARLGGAGAVGAAGSRAAVAVESNPLATPRSLVARGMQRFRAGDVGGSIEAFDAAMSLDPRFGDVLWQRGLSLYYADEFDKAAQQFERDFRLNPRDTEESIWQVIARSRNGAEDFSRAQRDMHEVVGEPREYMSIAYGVFKGRLPEEKLVQLASDGRRPRDSFYGALYLGLLRESQGDAAQAREWILRAVANSYGRESEDYMWYVAKTHAKVRGW